MCRFSVPKGVLLAVCLVSSMAFAADASIDQIYKAANAGMFREANNLMAQVLRDHPQSGKAHFVQAELLARQGQLLGARTELSTAERLAPGLPFAKPEALQSLNRQIDHSTGSWFDKPGLSSPAQGQGGQMLWQLILAAIAILIAGYFLFRRQSASMLAPAAMTGMPMASASNVPASPAWGTTSYAGTPPPMPMASPVAAPGMAGTLMGGLAAGAAMGAGMVAGQALMHRMMDGSLAAEPLRPAAPVMADPNASYDMGGNDFGMNDTSSWDDAGSGLDGGGDWS